MLWGWAICVIWSRLFVVFLGIIFVPFFKNFLPVDSFAVGNSFGLSQCLVVLLFLGMTNFHGLDGGIVEYLDATPTHALIEVVGPECLALNIKIGMLNSNTVRSV